MASGFLIGWAVTYGLVFPKILVAACLKITGWQSDLGRERRDQSGLLISIEVLSATAYLHSDQGWVRQRFGLFGFPLAHSGLGHMVAGERERWVAGGYCKGEGWLLFGSFLGSYNKAGGLWVFSWML